MGIRGLLPRWLRGDQGICLVDPPVGPVSICCALELTRHLKLQLHARLMAQYTKMVVGSHDRVVTGALTYGQQDVHSYRLRSWGRGANPMMRRNMKNKQ